MAASEIREPPYLMLEDVYITEISHLINNVYASLKMIYALLPLQRAPNFRQGQSPNGMKKRGPQRGPRSA